ncbi:MAG: transketolase [bacterium]
MSLGKSKYIDKVHSVKKRFLKMYRDNNAGHIGCSLSCTEILVFLKLAWMEESDSLILSKGHAAAVLYSVLAECGTISDEEINSFYKNGTYLGAHPPANKIKGIPFATGSLGHGLSLSAGRALASKIKRENRMFFCVTSDGELDEGSIWEAALFISHHKLNNIIWLIDRNNIQGFGRTEEVMALEPLQMKLESFGFYVASANGHSFDALSAAKDQCLSDGKAKSLPKVIICNTIKGHCISYMENTIDWHYLPMNEENYARACSDLDAEYERLGAKNEN